MNHTIFFYYQDPKDTPPPTRAETRDERRERKRREKAEQVAYKLEQEIAICKLSKGFMRIGFLISDFFKPGDPHNSNVATVDPFKTLFVARIVSESLTQISSLQVANPNKKLIFILPFIYFLIFFTIFFLILVLTS